MQTSPKSAQDQEANPELPAQHDSGPSQDTVSAEQGSQAAQLDPSRTMQVLPTPSVPSNLPISRPPPWRCSR